ncbi:hypothetical protein Bbelb_012720 [Branchiostoma belcheri]|nr:hypothetical protein Bbelb_012720 [Branchiostoma belcheri]
MCGFLSITVKPPESDIVAFLPVSIPMRITARKVFVTGGSPQIPSVRRIEAIVSEAGILIPPCLQLSRSRLSLLRRHTHIFSVRSYISLTGPLKSPWGNQNHLNQISCQLLMVEVKWCCQPKSENGITQSQFADILVRLGSS